MWFLVCLYRLMPMMYDCMNSYRKFQLQHSWSFFNLSKINKKSFKDRYLKIFLHHVSDFR